jgi:hypothetical protein
LSSHAAELKLKKAEVQKRLNSAETGFRGWWNGTSLSPQQFEAMTQKECWLLQEIKVG